MAVVKMRAIKPRKFKATVFPEELRREGKSIASQMKKDFELTTRTWKHQVNFRTRVTVASNMTIPPKGKSLVRIFVGTNDEIYGYVSEGTKGPYPIVAKNAPMLVFRSGYTAKTIPGAVGSQPGGAFGPFVSKLEVMHPGIKAREFDKQIGDQWENEFQRRMKNALQRARYRSQHAHS